MKSLFFILCAIITTATSRGQVPALLDNVAIQKSEEWSLSQKYVTFFMLAI